MVGRNLPVGNSRIVNVDLSLYYFTILLLLVTCSCSARAIGQPNLDKLLDRARMTVSVGMPVEDAKIKMEKLGFTCKLVENGTITYTDATNPQRAAIRNVKFLQCIARSRIIVGESVLDVQLLVEDGKVKEIYKVFETIAL